MKIVKLFGQKFKFSTRKSFRVKYNVRKSSYKISVIFWIKLFYRGHGQFNSLVAHRQSFLLSIPLKKTRSKNPKHKSIVKNLAMIANSGHLSESLL